MQRNRAKLLPILSPKRVKTVPQKTIEDIVKGVNKKNIDLLSQFEEAVKRARSCNYN